MNTVLYGVLKGLDVKLHTVQSDKNIYNVYVVGTGYICLKTVDGQRSIMFTSDIVDVVSFYGNGWLARGLLRKIDCPDSTYMSLLYGD